MLVFMERDSWKRHVHKSNFLNEILSSLWNNDVSEYISLIPNKQAECTIQKFQDFSEKYRIKYFKYRRAEKAFAVETLKFAKDRVARWTELRPETNGPTLWHRINSKESRLLTMGENSRTHIHVLRIASASALTDVRLSFFWHCHTYAVCVYVCAPLYSHCVKLTFSWFHSLLKLLWYWLLYICVDYFADVHYTL